VAYYFFYYLIGFYLHKNSDMLIVKNGLLIAVVGLAWFALGSIYSTGAAETIVFHSTHPLISTLLYLSDMHGTACNLVPFQSFNEGTYG